MVTSAASVWCHQLLSVILTSLATTVLAQDDFGGGDDAGGGDLDLESMMAPSGGAKTTANPNMRPQIVTKSLFEESVSALQQLGFIIGEYFCSGYFDIFPIFEQWPNFDLQSCEAWPDISQNGQTACTIAGM